MIQNLGVEVDEPTPEMLSELEKEICEMEELVLYEDTPSLLRDIAERARES